MGHLGNTATENSLVGILFGEKKVWSYFCIRQKRTLSLMVFPRACFSVS
jgi:hypothetical protein